MRLVPIVPPAESAASSTGRRGRRRRRRAPAPRLDGAARRCGAALVVSRATAAAPASASSSARRAIGLGLRRPGTDRAPGSPRRAGDWPRPRRCAPTACSSATMRSAASSIDRRAAAASARRRRTARRLPARRDAAPSMRSSSSRRGRWDLACGGLPPGRSPRHRRRRRSATTGVASGEVDHDDVRAALLRLGRVDLDRSSAPADAATARPAAARAHPAANRPPTRGLVRTSAAYLILREPIPRLHSQHNISANSSPASHRRQIARDLQACTQKSHTRNLTSRDRRPHDLTEDTGGPLSHAKPADGRTTAFQSESFSPEDVPENQSPPRSKCGGGDTRRARPIHRAAQTPDASRPGAQPPDELALGDFERVLRFLVARVDAQRFPVLDDGVLGACRACSRPGRGARGSAGDWATAAAPA